MLNRDFANKGEGNWKRKVMDRRAMILYHIQISGFQN